MPHECGHILLNDGNHVPDLTNMMFGTPSDVDAISSMKRLRQAQVDKARTSPDTEELRNKP